MGPVEPRNVYQYVHTKCPADANTEFYPSNDIQYSDRFEYLHFDNIISERNRLSYI